MSVVSPSAHHTDHNPSISPLISVLQIKEYAIAELGSEYPMPALNRNTIQHPFSSPALNTGREKEPRPLIPKESFTSKLQPSS